VVVVSQVESSLEKEACRERLQREAAERGSRDKQHVGRMYVRWESVSVSVREREGVGKEDVFNVK
jgi:hypothetical protein